MILPNLIEQQFLLCRKRYQPEWIERGLSFRFAIEHSGSKIEMFVERDGDEVIYMAKGLRVSTTDRLTKLAMYEYWLEKGGRLSQKLHHVLRDENGSKQSYLRRDVPITGDIEDNLQYFVETTANVVRELSQLAHDLAEVKQRRLNLEEAGQANDNEQQ